MNRVLAVAFWCGIFAVFLTPMELGDFWWHLASGRWIWEHKALPAIDPFSVTSDGTKGDSFVMGGFWLCQLAFYALYSAFSITGIILSKAAVFTATFFIIALTMKERGLGAPLRYAVLLPAAFISVYYDEMRPQSLSFLLFAAVIYILERARRTSDNRYSPHHAAALSLLMLLWANVHPGYILGDLMIAAYLGEGLLWWALRKAPAPHTLFVASCIGAVAMSALNPNGLEALSRTWGMVMASVGGTSKIHEHSPIKEFSSFTHQQYLYKAILGFIILGLTSFIRRIRTLDLLHLLMFMALAYLSLKTYRAGFFFAIAGTVIAGANLSGLELPRAFYGRAVRTAALCAIVAFAATALFPRTILKRPEMDGHLFPVKAASYIESAALPGNIYHPYEWGGYLMWRLYPAHKVFIDGRALGPMDRHREVLNAGPSWKKVLDEYDVNAVMYWPLLPYKGSVPPILMAMLGDSQWSPVYWDLQSVIFVRTPLAVDTIGRNAVWELLASLIGANISANPGVASNYSALGEVYLHRGLRRDAREAFLQALALDPQDRTAAFWLRSLGDKPL